ncbi:MAG TPA: isochorismatase family protein, partial [Verrucomicrobiae bacterium]|nr:isochorismatase family protein [Verrucomicrobiae bacterium]
PLRICGNIIIYKERASGFFGTPLVAHLTQRGIDSLIVCGENTSGCVRAKCVDAYSLGYHVTVVENVSLTAARCRIRSTSSISITNTRTP